MTDPIQTRHTAMINRWLELKHLTETRNDTIATVQQTYLSVARFESEQSELELLYNKLCLSPDIHKPRLQAEIEMLLRHSTAQLEETLQRQYDMHTELSKNIKELKVHNYQLDVRIRIAQRGPHKVAMSASKLNCTLGMASIPWRYDPYQSVSIDMSLKWFEIEADRHEKVLRDELRAARAEERKVNHLWDKARSSIYALHNILTTRLPRLGYSNAMTIIFLVARRVQTEYSVVEQTQETQKLETLYATLRTRYDQLRRLHQQVRRDRSRTMPTRYTHDHSDEDDYILSLHASRRVSFNLDANETYMY